MTGRHIITGGSGFVGSRLADTLLARGERVTVFDIVPPANGAVDFVPGNVQHPGDLTKLHLAAGDVVHHLAARQFHGAVPRRHRDSWFAAVNSAGTRHLLSAMSAGGASQLVFFSTDMTYGQPQMSPVPPTHVQAPIGPYGRSKLAAEQLILRAAEDFDLKATIFRPRLIAGAGRLGILARLFQLVAWNLPVPMIGSGRNRYQMIAVEDCVAAALRAVDCGLPAGPFNLGSEAPPTVRALLGSLVARAGSKSVLVPTPARAVQSVLGLMDRAGATLLYPEQFAIADSDYVLDTGPTTAALGWSPARRDEDIIFEAFRHFRCETAMAPVGSVSETSGLAATTAE
nr:NAD(P)-dependent oxidoreductase [Polymorphobacter sp.]